MTTTFQLKGLDDIVKAIEKLPKAMKRKIHRKVLRPMSKKFKKAVQEETPVDKGNLKKQVIVRASKRSRVRIGVVVSVTGMIGAKTQGKGFYGAFINYGYTWSNKRRKRKAQEALAKEHVGDREKQIPANPYVRRAYDKIKSSNLKFALEEYKKLFDEAVKDVAV